MALQIIRLVLIIALLGAAAAIATPKGRLPLALRGLQKIMRKDRGVASADPRDRGEAVSAGRKALAFALVLAALALAMVSLF